MKGIVSIGLLVITNIFIFLAWYGHLKYRTSPIWLAIFLSWGVALFEYSFQVPANRMGSAVMSVTQLKILQEAITLVVFTIIAYLIFGETLKWNNLVSYALLFGAVYFAFLN